MASDKLEIRGIAALEAQGMRDLVLRPHLAPGSIHRTDHAHETLHLAAWAGDLMVGVATISNEPFPNTASNTDWRLRGMAILEDWRRRGLGKRLTEACIAHAKKSGGTFIWCSARSEAFPFYEALGFVLSGPPVSREGYGPMKFALMTLNVE